MIMTYAIIPARRGSKRIPGKNHKLFLGEPLISYPLRYLCSTDSITAVYVSTDSKEIKEICKEFGPGIALDRRPELSGDHTSTLSVMKHVLLQKANSIDPEAIILCVYPAAVLDQETWARIIESTKILEDEFLVTVGRMRNNPERSLTRVRDSNDFMKMSLPEMAGARSQDLAPSFYDAGKVYAARAKVWLSANSILGGSFRAIELPFWAAQDLDEVDDWEIAESLVKSRIGQ